MHFQLKFFPQTLFIAVSYMDQFCAVSAIKENELYLLGATCLLISGKFEETYKIPSIRSIQELSGKNLDKEEIIRMESRIMEELNFSLIVDSPSNYL